MYRNRSTGKKKNQCDIEEVENPHSAYGAGIERTHIINRILISQYVQRTWIGPEICYNSLSFQWIESSSLKS